MGTLTSTISPGEPFLKPFSFQLRGTGHVSPLTSIFTSAIQHHPNILDKNNNSYCIFMFTFLVKILVLIFLETY